MQTEDCDDALGTWMIQFDVELDTLATRHCLEAIDLVWYDEECNVLGQVRRARPSIKRHLLTSTSRNLERPLVVHVRIRAHWSDAPFPPNASITAGATVALARTTRAAPTPQGVAIVVHQTDVSHVSHALTWQGWIETHLHLPTTTTTTIHLHRLTRASFSKVARFHARASSSSSFTDTTTTSTTATCQLYPIHVDDDTPLDPHAMERVMVRYMDADTSVFLLVHLRVWTQLLGLYRCCMTAQQRTHTSTWVVWPCKQNTDVCTLLNAAARVPLGGQSGQDDIVILCAADSLVAIVADVDQTLLSLSHTLSCTHIVPRTEQDEQDEQDEENADEEGKGQNMANPLLVDSLSHMLVVLALAASSETIPSSLALLHSPSLSPRWLDPLITVCISVRPSKQRLHALTRTLDALRESLVEFNRVTVLVAIHDCNHTDDTNDTVQALRRFQLRCETDTPLSVAPLALTICPVRWSYAIDTIWLRRHMLQRVVTPWVCWIDQEQLSLPRRWLLQLAPFTRATHELAAVVPRNSALCPYYAGTLYRVSSLRQLPSLFSYDADMTTIITTTTTMPDHSAFLLLPPPPETTPLFAPQLLPEHAQVNIDRHLFESLCLESATRATCTLEACLTTSDTTRARSSNECRL
jgi:hypothetical protein